MPMDRATARERARSLNDRPLGKGPVLYWMSRDQRVRDNWALVFAKELAGETGGPLEVVFCLSPRFLKASPAHFDFMLNGLREVEASLARMGVRFTLLEGDPAAEFPRYADSRGAGAVVCDFDPLRIKRRWRSRAARQLDISVHEVDAHNIVPCWLASDKQEYGAYTLRPRIHRLLPRFLTPIPGSRPRGRGVRPGTDWEALMREDDGGELWPVRSWIRPGESAALRALKRFVARGLAGYSERKNDPGKDGPSNLSPFIHFGQLSAQRIALEVERASAPIRDRESFLEELIVRRELSDNFCHHNPGYDSARGFPTWAQKTLEDHLLDPREYLYTKRELVEGTTHDPYWNAAQREMVLRGKMHGYMRMYWAKKILEWSPTPERAMKTAIELNDRFSLDGRDPNGYTGIAWSIGGVHDRAWGERPVFGKIRYMSEKGLRSKFDMECYLKKVEGYGLSKPGRSW